LEIVPVANASVVFRNACVNFTALGVVEPLTIGPRGCKIWVSRCSKFSFESRCPSRMSGKDKLFDHF